MDTSKNNAGLILDMFTDAITDQMIDPNIVGLLQTIYGELDKVKNKKLDTRNAFIEVIKVLLADLVVSRL